MENLGSLQWLDVKIKSAPTWYNCAPAWSWQPSAMPDFNFWFVASGRGELDFRGEKFPLVRGQFFLWQPNDLPRATHDPKHPLRLFACHFEPTQNRDFSQCWPRSIPIDDVDFFEAVSRRAAHLWRREGVESRQESTRLLLSLLWLLRDEIEFPSPSRDERMEQLAARLQVEFSRPWTLDDMARETHLSRSQLARRFRARFEKSAQEFLLQIRLENARQLVLETDFSLHQIAIQNGFCDAAHFANAFKKFFGKAPGTLRKTSKKF